MIFYKRLLFVVILGLLFISLKCQKQGFEKIKGIWKEVKFEQKDFFKPTELKTSKGIWTLDFISKDSVKTSVHNRNPIVVKYTLSNESLVLGKKKYIIKQFDNNHLEIIEPSALGSEYNVKRIFKKENGK